MTDDNEFELRKDQLNDRNFRRSTDLDTDPDPDDEGTPANDAPRG